MPWKKPLNVPKKRGAGQTIFSPRTPPAQIRIRDLDDGLRRRQKRGYAGRAKVGKKLIVVCIRRFRLAHTPGGEPQVRFSQRNRYVYPFFFRDQ